MFKKHKILAVDDDSKVLAALNRIFIDDRWIDLVTTTDPNEAMRTALRDNIDLIIVDQQMPGMTGIDLLGKVVPERPDIISIVLTGYPDMKVVLKAINDIGVYKFILKPWKNEDIYWTVVRALEMKEIVNNNKHLDHELKKRDACLRELERNHPGITKVNRDSQGLVVID